MKKLSLFVSFLLLLVFCFSVQSFAQITFGTWLKENDAWRQTTTTTQLTTATGKDTTATFQLKDIDNDIKIKNVEGVNISTWFRSADADSASISVTLQGGYLDAWNGALWQTIDGPDTGTTANNVINEIQFSISGADLAYPYYRILYTCNTGHTLETNTTTLYWFVHVNYDK